MTVIHQDANARRLRAVELLSFSVLICCLSLLTSTCIAQEALRSVDAKKYRSVKAPAYPIAARRDGACGFAKIAVSVNEAGLVEDARVLIAEPQGYFEEASLAAARAWTFVPQSKDGQAIKFQGTVPLHFELDGGCDKSNRPPDEILAAQLFECNNGILSVYGLSATEALGYDKEHLADLMEMATYGAFALVGSDKAPRADKAAKQRSETALSRALEEGGASVDGFIRRQVSQCEAISEQHLHYIKRRVDTEMTARLRARQ